MLWVLIEAILEGNITDFYGEIREIAFYDAPNLEGHIAF